jgi:hypothetical protein
MPDWIITGGLMAAWFAGAVVVILVCDWLFGKAISQFRPTVDDEPPVNLWNVKEWE